MNFINNDIHLYNGKNMFFNKSMIINEWNGFFFPDYSWDAKTQKMQQNVLGNNAIWIT